MIRAALLRKCLHYYENESLRPLDEAGNYNNIELMTHSSRLPNYNGGMFSQILRAAFLTMTAIGGLFLLFFSAAFVLILIAGIVVIALIVAAVFWARAKILGKPFGPKAQLDKMRRDMEQELGGDFNAQFGSATKAKSSGNSANPDGPIIDAHQTPEGWSVDN